MAGLIILSALPFAFYWGVFSSSNWDKYYFKKISWSQIISDPASHKEPLIAFIVILAITIIAITIDEMRMRRKSRNQIEQRKSFISTSSPNEYLLYAIFCSLVSLLGILFIVIPFLHEGNFSIQNIKENSMYFINIVLTILATIYFMKRYKHKRTIDSSIEVSQNKRNSRT